MPIACCVVLLSGSAGAWAADPSTATQPAATSVSATQPAPSAPAPRILPTEPARDGAAPDGVPSTRPAEGSVSFALRQLYIVPRQGNGHYLPHSRLLNDPPAPDGIHTPDHLRHPLPGRANDRSALGPSGSASESPESTTDPSQTAAPPERINPPAEREEAPPAYVFSASAVHRPRALPKHLRDWSQYRYYDGNPSRYGYGRYAPYSEDTYGGDYFRFGFMEGYDSGQFEGRTDERVESVVAHANVNIQRGLAFFREGEYLSAADAFQLAAEMDQGDPVSRIYAGHALFAMGRYRDAVSHLRRSFELQPRIVFLNYDLRQDYGRPEDFAIHLQALDNALKAAPDDRDRLFLISYIRYYAGNRTGAYPTLTRLCRLNREDTLARRLMLNAQPPDVELDAMRSSRPAQ